MKIRWLELSKNDIKAIHNFYAKDKSVRVANNICNEIVQMSRSLSKFPYMAPIEFELTDKKGKEYRSLLVRKQYKVVYFIEDDFIYIAAVWDCRTDPQHNIGRISDNF